MLASYADEESRMKIRLNNVKHVESSVQPTSEGYGYRFLYVFHEPLE